MVSSEKDAFNVDFPLQIPFPAVTVCPITKVRQRVFNYTEMYKAINFLNALNISELDSNDKFNISDGR